MNRAHRLDKGLGSLCGLQIGYTFIFGLIPVLGDIVDALLSYYLIVKRAEQSDIPQWLVVKMLANNSVSIAVGLVPIVGDIFLAQWKANSRNSYLLEEYLTVRGQEYLAAVERQQNGPTPALGKGTFQEQGSEQEAAVIGSKGQGTAVPGAKVVPTKK